MNKTHSQSLSAEYFERLYAKDPDPWRFASSEYERRKYAASLRALEDRRVELDAAGGEVGRRARLGARRLERALAGVGDEREEVARTLALYRAACSN